ncbi:MAG: CDP-alcohol phosphatidyltransferase family protein [Ornithinimicrobium sp.]|uniref:CDP-alcohol phosphatidyltransferase family protein n=1 Tax=Ornithinimicrobium sp. TaxID=1977084 RepID=UPI0026E04B96|nr:CDP-alcohol phosphatidyltransferase family protein [Ornithinimicrobium sp.]MDO5741097.1 CDP-alcohol phosphatidyltransferase family protein [Ornithinimicrobium sp.]
MTTDTGGLGTVSNRVLTVPNALSVFRLCLLPVFLWSAARGDLAWAGLALVVSGVSDFLDGYIARRYGLITRLGQLLDPISDRLFIATTVIGLAWFDLIPWWLVATLVLRDFLVGAMLPVVRRHHLPIPPVHFVGKAATFNLLGAFPLILFGHLDGWWSILSLATGWAMAWWGIVLYWVSGLIYAWQVKDMVRQLGPEVRA